MPTQASFLINCNENLDIYTVKKFLNHTNIKITDKYYIDYNVIVARK
jgi:integrase